MLENAFGAQNVSSDFANLQATNVDLDATDLEHTRDIKELQRKLHEADVKVTDEFNKLREEIVKSGQLRQARHQEDLHSNSVALDTCKRFESLAKISRNESYTDLDNWYRSMAMKVEIAIPGARILLEWAESMKVGLTHMAVQKVQTRL